MAIKTNRLAFKILLGSFLTVVAVIALGALLLLRGIELDQLSVATLQLDNLKLRLDGKLQLEVGAVHIKPGDSDATAEPAEDRDTALLKQALTGIKYLKRLFSEVEIRQITIGDLAAQFRYREGGAGKLSLLGPDTDILIRIDSVGETLLFDIEHLRMQELGLELSGDLTIDADALLLEAQLHALLADTLALDVKLQADHEQLSFQGAGVNPVTDIEPIISLFKLGPNIDPWIIDYLRAGKFELQSVSGTLPYDEPEAILQTLRAEALVEDIKYTFAQGLEPVLADRARVLFEQGILHIYPQEATLYGQDTGDTSIDIDFNDEKLILLVYVRTRAQLSGGIITLLEHYGIPLPFQQVAGLTDTDLTLQIDLDTVEVTADGQFLSRDSRFEIGGQPLEIAALDIDLATTAITFNQLDASLPKLMSASITGGLNITDRQGDLDIAVTEFLSSESNSPLALTASTANPLRLSYHLRNTGDSIDVPVSNWQYGDMPIAIEEFTTSFDPTTLSGELENVGVSIDSSLSAQVSGHYQAQAPYAQLQIAINKLQGDSLRLEQASADLALEVGDKIKAETKAPIRLSVDGIDVRLDPTRLQYSGNELLIQKSAFRVAPGTTADLQGTMDFSDGEGRLLLYDLKLRNQAGKLLFGAKRSIGLTVSYKGGALKIGIPRLGAVFALRKDNSWSADINDIGHLYTMSPLLQQLRLSRGEVHVRSSTGALPYRINGQFTLPYGVLLGPDHQAIQDYSFTGSFDGEELQLDFNRMLQLSWADSIDISSTDVGFSVSALADIFEALGSPDAAKASPQQRPEPSAGNALSVSLHARNSFIALDDMRGTPVDELFASYKNGKTSAKFYYKGGFAALDFADGHISAGSNQLDISVLTDFVTLADFEGGTVEFRAEGTLDELRGAMRIQNTVIKDYKHLNNMLAFINTLPGLLTFNPPDYNSQGLPAREAYFEANYKSGVVEMESLVVDSSELDIRGSGILDLNKNTTDMTFNLISGARKSVGRIPVIGFILVGDDKQPTITLKVSGDLENPTVSNSAAKDLVAYPWQLIKNTVSLPGRLSDQLQSEPTTATPTP